MLLADAKASVVMAWARMSSTLIMVFAHAEADAPLGQDVFDLPSSLPAGLGFHQGLSNPSR